MHTIYGFLLTLIMGFILTAGGHWSGNGPLKGQPIINLFTLWLIDQLAFILNINLSLSLITSLLLIVYFIFLLNNLLNGYAQRKRSVFFVGLFGLCKILYLASFVFKFTTFNQYILSITTWVLI